MIEVEGDLYLCQVTDKKRLEVDTCSRKEVQPESLSQLAQLIPHRCITYNVYHRFLNLEIPRYTIFILDSSKHNHPRRRMNASSCGVLLVPQGREHEFMFAVKEGQMQVTDNTAFARLIFVHFSRYHTFGGLDNVKAELSPLIRKVAQMNVIEPIPFVIPGEESGIGNRVVIYNEKTCDGSDRLLVEDISFLPESVVESDTHASDEWVRRRLILLSNPNMIQSELRMNSRTQQIDHTFLCLEFHRVMLSGMALSTLENTQLPYQTIDMLSLDPTSPFTSLCCVLVIGLGGGALPMILHDLFPSCLIDVVELNSDIIEIAEKFFNLNTSSHRMNVHCADGIEYIQMLSEEIEEMNNFVSPSAANDKKLDYIFLDVSGSSETDISTGLTSPPSAFLTLSFLQKLELCLKSTGVLIFNLVCRSQPLRIDIISRIRTIFKEVYEHESSDNANRILFVLPTCHNPPISPNFLAKRVPIGTDIDFVKYLHNIKLHRSVSNTTIERSKSDSNNPQSVDEKNIARKEKIAEKKRLHRKKLKENKKKQRKR